jgi:XisI protein
MEKIKKYQNIIKNVIKDYIATDKSNPEEEVYLVADDINMHYLLYHNAWRHDSRTYGCILHLRIKNEKIYVEYDGTDVGFADVFAEHNIPKKDIVLAFHAPTKRPYTGFAAA